MGNANGREDGANGGPLHESGDPSETRRSNGDLINNSRPPPPVSSHSMANSPPGSPSLSRSPLNFAPQIPVAPLQRNDGHPPFNQMWQNESQRAELPHENGIPTLIAWNFGGNDVSVEGSWDSWTSRKTLQRSGKDHCILMVLPSGIYHYKFIVDGQQRYIPDLPFVADEMGHVCNVLDVHDYVPENPENAAEFEAPPSPTSSYGVSFPGEEDFAKEPVSVPPQLHQTAFGAQNLGDNGSSSSTPSPQHVVLNHLFIEKGRSSPSVVALGLTHRYRSKYVTVVVYKPVKN